MSGLTSLSILMILQASGEPLGASSWKPIASAGVQLDLNRTSTPYGPGISMRYDFKGQAGFVLAEAPFKKKLPSNYEFSFWVKATSPANDFEFKLMDPSGASVWWVKKHAFLWPQNWTRMVIRKSDLVYAWGPQRTPMPESGAIQFGIAANAGGSGFVEFGNPEFRERPAVQPFSSSIDINPISNVTRVPGSATWSVGPRQAGSLEIKLRGLQNIGAVKLTGLSEEALVRLDAEDQPGQWRNVAVAGPVIGGTTYLSTPNVETSRLRLTLDNFGRDSSTILSGIEVRSADFARSAPQLWESIAKESMRGLYPKHLLGQQQFFTVSGSVRGEREALISEAGQVEFDRMSPLLEPFLLESGQLRTWANTTIKQGLSGRFLPLPTVTWAGETELQIETFASENFRDDQVVNYRVSNKTSITRRPRLYLALRPFQVNPSWQALNLNPLVAPINELRVGARGELQVDGKRYLVPSERPSRVGLTSLSRGDVVPFLMRGTTPITDFLNDPDGRASGLMAFDMVLGPNETKTISVAWRNQNIPWTVNDAIVTRQTSVSAWRNALKTPEFSVPVDAQLWVDVALANLGYILVNRDGPSIQPGSRTYQRSWMRDGALTCTALLQFGMYQPVREFIDWYAPAIRADGWVPCVLDKRGPDPLAEHDSHGQFLYLLAQYVRFTKDTAYLQRHKDTIRRVVNQIRTLRASRIGPSFDDPAKIERGFRGLFPESASHEGYMDHHRHSYWDDFFGIKGLYEAEWMAGEMGETSFKQEISILRKEFEQSFLESIQFTMNWHKISYIPGCVELGDFDATSTAIGVYPGGALRYLPKSLFDSTFDRYSTFFDDRAKNRITWRDYTPYEVRVLSAMFLLGRKERAHEMMDWFARDLRPQPWLHWAEVGYADPTPGRWIGDMPHTWVGSEYIKAFRMIWAHERETDGALVFGMGLPESWLIGDGVKVTNLPTHLGKFNLRAHSRGKTSQFWIGGDSVRRVPLRLANPRKATPISVTVNGKPARLENNEVALPQVPCTVIFTYTTNSEPKRKP